MSATQQSSTPRPPPLDDQLLEAKLSIPLPRAGLVSRAPLVEVARSSRRRVVDVTAPAGYGKSSMLTQWAALEDRPVAWVSLDRFDDDPVALLTLLAAAVARAMGGDPGIVAEVRGHPGAVLARSAPRLASILHHSDPAFVLMVDDLHVLKSPACHDVLGIVISGVPDGSQFVAASRTTQPHVASLRAADGVQEIGAEQLALDAAGARQIFHGVHLELTPESAASLVERTEGWPVGLHLAAMIARDSNDPRAVIVGRDRYVADYLYRESLATLPEDYQRFLRRTAVLEHLSQDLCNALVGDEGTPVRLQELEDANVFLIPQDRTRTWYRYHPLFREFLLGVLQHDEPNLIPVLHARAAQWYQAHDSAVMAIEHLLQLPDVTRPAELISAVGRPTYGAGEMATVQRWLATLGETAVLAYPPLAVLSAWMVALSGDGPETERLAAALRGLTFDGTPVDGTTSFASSRAMFMSAICAAGPEQMRADAQFAFDAEPAWSPWRDLTLRMMGEAHLLVGEDDQADAYLAEASHRAYATGNFDVQVPCDAERALIAMDQGRWPDATELVDAAIRSVEEHGLQDYATSVMAFAAAARLALHNGDRKRSARELTRAMRGRPACTYSIPMIAVRIRRQLALTAWAIGDPQTARHLVREIDDILLERPDLGILVEQCAKLKSLVTSPSVEVQGGSPLTPAELRLLPYLQTHLTYPSIASRLFVSKNTVASEVSAIYRKLGVSSRNEAVVRATELGLLGG